jgi:hypothetical protein
MAEHHPAGVRATSRQLARARRVVGLIGLLSLQRTGGCFPHLRDDRCPRSIAQRNFPEELWRSLDCLGHVPPTLLQDQAKGDGYGDRCQDKDN